jgi:hypothetical protein
MVNDKRVNAALSRPRSVRICAPKEIGTREGTRKEKRAAVAGGSKVNREASNRVDRSHSMSNKMDAYSNEGESLISP